MKPHFDIKLGVSIGEDLIVNKNQHFESVFTRDIQITIVIDSQLLKSKKQRQFLGYQIQNDVQNQLSIFSTQPTNNESNALIISNKGEDFCYIFPYRICLKKTLKSLQSILLNINLQLKFYSIENAKFINNKKLQSILRCEQEDWGYISMDSSGRIITEFKQTEYPLIGIWSKSFKPKEQIHNMRIISDYLCSRSGKKCRFTKDKKNYIYFATFKDRRSQPKLQLVEWNFGQQIKREISKQWEDISLKGQVIFSSVNEMEFTLRSNEKPVAGLANLDFSPIEQTKKQPFEDSFDNIEIIDSPRFNESQRSDQGKQVLQQTVKSQQKEILLLKNEVLYLRNELAYYRNKVTYIENSSKLLQQSNDKDRDIIDSTSKPIRRLLRESDLKCNSASTREQGSSGSENNSGNGFLENFRSSHLRQVQKREKKQNQDQIFDNIKLVE